MASESEAREISALFERFLTRQNTDLSLFIPFILGFASRNIRQDGNNNNNESNPSENQAQRIILINPFTQGMVVIEASEESMMIIRELVNKSETPPASKSSIEAMPSVECEEVNGECVICLEEWKVGESLKEMPCKHRFHPNCITKWLGIHGSCPLCRYKMPFQDCNKNRDDDESRREIWVSFSLRRNRESGVVDDEASSEDSDSSQRLEDHEI